MDTKYSSGGWKGRFCKNPVSCWQYSSHSHTAWKGESRKSQQFRTALTCIILMLLRVRDNVEAPADRYPKPLSQTQSSYFTAQDKRLPSYWEKDFIFEHEDMKAWLVEKIRIKQFFFFFLIKQYHFKTLAQIIIITSRLTFIPMSAEPKIIKDRDMSLVIWLDISKYTSHGCV